MSVLNAFKNKLLARVIAVVNKQEEYVKKIFGSSVLFYTNLAMLFIYPR